MICCKMQIHETYGYLKNVVTVHRMFTSWISSRQDGDVQGSISRDDTIFKCSPDSIISTQFGIRYTIDFYVNCTFKKGDFNLDLIIICFIISVFTLCQMTFWWCCINDMSFIVLCWKIHIKLQLTSDMMTWYHNPILNFK